MKKLLIALLLVVFCAGAFAEDGEEAYQFTFRNGVKWGDSVDAVYQAEGEEAPAYPYRDHTMVEYDDAAVSKFTADYLDYFFSDDGLMFAAYTFIHSNDDERTYICEALSSKYGERAEVNTEMFLYLAGIIGGKQEECTLFANWQTEDDTYIAACTMGKVFYILYYDGSDGIPAAGEYNTNGL